MDNKFGVYMRQLRKSKGLTLKQVEHTAKVSNAYISQIERGLRNPPHPDILKRLAGAYDVTHRELLIAAGYLEDPEEQIKREKVEKESSATETGARMNWNDKVCVRWCCRWIYFRRFDERIGYRNSTFLTYRQTEDASMGYGKTTYEGKTKNGTARPR